MIGHKAGHNNPVLLMIHGWGFGPEVWRPLADKVKDKVRLLIPPLPGYNNTATADPVRMLADQLAGHGPCFVLGWSLGGLLAIELAVRFPERIQALGLIAALPCFSRSPDWPAGWQPAALTAVREKLEHDATAARHYVAALSARGDNDQRRLRRVLRQGSTVSSTALTSGLDHLAGADLRRAFSGLHMPITVWLGAEDALLGGDCATALTGLRSQIRVQTLAGAGHALLISRAEVIARDLIQEWF